MPWSGFGTTFPVGNKLWCSAIGIAPINITIIRDSAVVANGTNYASIQTSGDGIYKCRASSKDGTDEREILISGELTKIVSTFGLLLQPFNMHISC